MNETLPQQQIIISCKEYSKEVNKIKKYAEQIEETILLKEGEQRILIVPSEIYYIESVDKRTFIYLKSGVGECIKRLYELEEILDKNYFLRISKSCIVNISYVKSISLMINRNLTLNLKNGEKVIVSRRYVKKFNEVIGMNE